MPLIKQTLEQKLKTRIKALEPKLYEALNSKTKGLYKAQLLADVKITDTAPSSGFGLYDYKNTLWETNAKEWGAVLSKEIINILADDLSEIIADEITSYIKSATIITPPGQVVAVATPTGPGTGSTTSPSSPAKIT